MTRHTTDSEMDRALAEDAAKLEEMGQDPGPTVEDIYEDFAATLPQADGKSDKRQIGKVRELGVGYGGKDDPGRL